MSKGAVVVRRQGQVDPGFRASRAQREYLRARLDDPGGRVEDHARVAGVNRSTVSRWMGDEGFRHWLRGEERRVVREYVEPMLLKLVEIGRASEDEDTKVSAINAFLRNLPGKSEEAGGDVAMKAVLEMLVARPAAAVQVVVNSSGGVGGGRLPEGAARVEKLAMMGGVLSVSKGVGPSAEEVTPVVAKEEPAVAVAYVRAAEREMEEALAKEKEGKSEAVEREATVVEVDPWAGIRGAKKAEEDALRAEVQDE